MSDLAVLDREHLRRLSKSVTTKDMGTATMRELAVGLAQTLDVLETVERALAQARQKADAAANSLRATHTQLSHAREDVHTSHADCEALRLEGAALRTLLQEYRQGFRAIAERFPLRRFAPHEVQRLQQIAEGMLSKHAAP